MSLTIASSVREAWAAVRGRAIGEDDVEQLFKDFVPLQTACIREFSDVIDGEAETVARLRAAGVRIGSSTGYTRTMLEPILPDTTRQGYAADAVVTPDDVGAGHGGRQVSDRGGWPPLTSFKK